LSDLFSGNSPEFPVDRSKPAPLAEQLRPQTPDEVIGQQHLLGPGKPLRLAFESGQPHSMILWGPPGVGKTTLARMMATQFECEFIALSAVFSGIKEVREAVAQAEMWRAQGGGPSSSSMKSTASTRRSRTAFCPSSNRLADLHRGDDREPVVRGQFGACCRGLRSMCCSRSMRPRWASSSTVPASGRWPI
jgi:hypothetical protein